MCSRLRSRSPRIGECLCLVMNCMIYLPATSLRVFQHRFSKQTEVDPVLKLYLTTVDLPHSLLIRAPCIGRELCSDTNFQLKACNTSIHNFHSTPSSLTYTKGSRPTKDDFHPRFAFISLLKGRRFWLRLCSA